MQHPHKMQKTCTWELRCNDDRALPWRRSSCLEKATRRSARHATQANPQRKTGGLNTPCPKGRFGGVKIQGEECSAAGLHCFCLDIVATGSRSWRVPHIHAGMHVDTAIILQERFAGAAERTVSLGSSAAFKTAQHSGQHSNHKVERP